MKYICMNWLKCMAGMDKNLKIALSIQLAMLGAIGLDVMEIGVPTIRQFVGFIYLTFNPGILIIQIFKLHKLNVVKTMLYTVGLSISSLMLLGYVLNMSSHLIGLSKPLSAYSVIIAVNIFTFILSFLAYSTKHNIIEANTNKKKHFHITILLPILVLLPVLSVFGTESMNKFGNNFLILLLILTISIVILLATVSKRFLSECHYPFAIMTISISLLYMMSLISPYVIGWDIHHEYYFANLVYDTSYWDYSISENVNGTLSIAILPIIYSHILNLQIDQIFKIIYPLIFSLVPLGLYELYRKEMGRKIAFVSVCFFMSSGVFFVEMLQLCRQQIAELFFVLLLLSLFQKNEDMPLFKRKILTIIFGTSIIISHYGTAYIFMFYIIFGFVLVFLLSNYTHIKINTNQSLGFIMLYITICLTWYIHVSESSSFNAIVNIGDRILSSLSDFASANTKDPTIVNRIYQSDLTSMEKLKMNVEYLTMSFIAIGFIKSYLLLIKNKKLNYSIDLFSMAFVSIFIIAMAIGLPYFAGSFNMSRLYFQTLFFLSPFFVFGGMTIFETISNQFRRTMKINSLFFVSLIIVSYFLLSTGFMYVITDQSKDTFTPPYLEKEGIFNDLIYISSKEVSSANWLSTNINKDSNIYADKNAKWMVLRSHATRLDVTSWTNDTKIIENSYIYLRELNVEGKFIEKSNEHKYTHKYTNILNSTFYSMFVVNCSKIYDNGGSYDYMCT